MIGSTCTAGNGLSGGVLIIHCSITRVLGVYFGVIARETRYIRVYYEMKNNRRRMHILGYASASGAFTEEVTPVPIPNTAVKLLRADDTLVRGK